MSRSEPAHPQTTATVPAPADSEHPPRGAISLRGVRKTYQRGRGRSRESYHALDNIDLDIAGGSITGIIGRSGAGKSTLLRTINMLAVPDAGEVCIDGVSLTAARGEALAAQRRKTGMIFQHFSLMGSKTVWQNIALPLRIAGVADAEVDRRVVELIELVGLLDLAHAYPVALSGGQKQRVAIARALVHDPEILLSDEATSALDPETTRSILGLMRRINRERGVTVVLITHEMSVVEEIADQVVIVDGGRVIEHGPTWRIFGAPSHQMTRELVRAARRDDLDDIRERLNEIPQGERFQYVARFDGHETGTLNEVLREAPDAHILISDVRVVQGRSQGYLVFESSVAGLSERAHGHFRVIAGPQGAGADLPPTPGLGQIA